ncbi:MAG: hypothetical protein ACRDFB_10000 [Rhabdochlamydiaceae bacterium]
MNDNSLFKLLIVFVIGAIAGAWIMTNYPTTYQGKTAEEWNADYTQELNKENQASQLPDPFKGLINCLSNMNKYIDYNNGSGYYVSDVSDIGQCIDDAQQQEYDNSSQILDQQDNTGN